MATPLTKKLLLIPLISGQLFLLSCQKGPVIELDPTPEIPAEIKDSTYLIKSITHVWNGGMPVEDSIIEHYAYDTINRKITLTWSGPDINEILNSTVVQLNYNSQGLLVNATYNYPSQFTPGEYDYSSIDIFYDATSILRKITVKYGDGSVKITDFEKEMLNGGRYQLTWKYTDAALPGDIFARRYVFDAEGKNIINALEYTTEVEIGSTGMFARTTKVTEDSLTYGSEGSAIRVTRTITDTLMGTTESFTLYEFEGRQSKGDQMYNHRQMIMHGIANIPFRDGDDIVENAFGVVSFTMDYEYLQYSRYPIQRTKARMWDGSFQEFNSPLVFDNKDRLKKFTGFFHDTELAPFENRITYFK